MEKNKTRTTKAAIISNVRFIILQFFRISGVLFNRICVFILYYNEAFSFILFFIEKEYKYFQVVKLHKRVCIS